MHRITIIALLLCCLGLASAAGPASAKTKHPVYVPPNQSAASQYTEDVPTAGGSAPSSSVHGSGSGGGSTHGSAVTVIPSHTLSQLDASGAAGTAAASLAQALAPTTVPAAAAQRDHSGKTATKSTVPVAAATGAPAARVIGTLTGSDAGGGLGVLLPIILIVSLVGATGFGLMRIRRAKP